MRFIFDLGAKCVSYVLLHIFFDSQLFTDSQTTAAEGSTRVYDHDFVRTDARSQTIEKVKFLFCALTLCLFLCECFGQNIF